MREPALHTVYTKREAMIAVRDGVRLYTAIYAPADSRPHPVVLLRSPYPLHPYGKGFAKTNPYSFYSFYKAFPDIFQTASGNLHFLLAYKN